MAATDQPYRNQLTLDVVFGVSCVLMLLTTGWMFWQDYNREYKSVQRTFRDVESSLAERDMVDKLPDPDTVAEKRKALRRARLKLEKAQDYQIDTEGYRIYKPKDSEGKQKVDWEGKKYDVTGKEKTKTLAEWDTELRAKRDQADEKYRTIKADFDSKTSYYNIAVDDAARYPEGSSERKAREKAAEKKKEELVQIQKDLDAAKIKRDEIDTEYRNKVRAWLIPLEKNVADAEDDEKKVTGAFDRYAKLATQKAWGAGDTFRDLPILDAFESPTKIKQIWLPDLTIDYSFKEVPRYDRCTSCHLGIDRAIFDKQSLTKLGNEEENNRLRGKLIKAQEMLQKRQDAGEKLGFEPADLPGQKSAHLGLIALLLVLSSIVAAGSLGVLERSSSVGVRVLAAGLAITILTTAAVGYFAPKTPAIKTVSLSESKGEVTQFAVHPRLELFVDSNSPHSMEKFGCTICHAGQGSATEFNLASHRPNDALQEHKWKKHHGWASSHFWDYPMLSKRFVESSCVKCHHQMTDLYTHGSKEEAPKLLRGYNLVKENGCFGCHEISGMKGGRPVGPDLRLEPQPALQFLTATDQEKAHSDPANPVGVMRKVGPSLRRLAEKTDEGWTRRWVQAPRNFRPDTKMPHFYGLSTNNEKYLAENAPSQKDFPRTEIHGIAHYLLTESKSTLSDSDFYRQALLKDLGGKEKDKQGKETFALKGLQASLVKTGLSDKETKELFDVSKRFADLALLSNPMQASAINSHSHEQRQLQERLSELQKRLVELQSRAADKGEIEAVKKEIATAAGELDRQTEALAKLARPIPLSERLVGEDGAAVNLPAKEGDAAKGRQWFTERGCLACHSHNGTIAPTGGIPVISLANFAPDLSRVAAKLRPAIGKDARRWLVQWLLNPNVHHPRTRMPITHLSVEQANDIAAWLMSQKATDWSEPDPARPDLTNIKALARVYLGKAPGVTLTDLDAFLPADGAEMPGIPAERLAFFARDAEERKLEKGKVTEEALLWYIGKKAIGRQGCYACHDIPGFETAKPIGTALNDWGKKDPERLAFEDASTFAKTHFNIVPSRKTRQEVLARKAFLEAKKDRNSGEENELERLERQLKRQDRIHELEKKAEKPEGLTSAEQRELEKFGPTKLFEEYVDPEIGMKKPPVEEIFFQALEHPHQTREGFLHQKLMDPRSYDFNRERPWDDRLRMPQFQFARLRKLPGEKEEDFKTRQHVAESEAREAVMTFILGLTAEPIPLQYVHQPKAEKNAEVIGRQMLDKFNCAGCHQVRPGVYEFKQADEIVKRLQQTLENSEAALKIDFNFPGHSAWVGTTPTSDKLTAFGYFDLDETKKGEEDAPNTDAIRLTDALRFVGNDKIPRDLRAGMLIRLPRGGYTVAGQPYGGGLADLLVPYLLKKNPTAFPTTDLGKSRAVLPPPLVREGERVQPDWLYKFLLHPTPIRPEGYVILRMPKFNMSPEEARALVNYFAAVSRRTNPGAGVSYPYVTIPQRDDEYWKTVNEEYAKRLGEKGIAERAKAMKPIWQARAKKEQSDLEAALPELKKAAKEAADKKAPDVAERDKAVKNAESRLEAVKKELKDGSFPEQQARWKSQEIYSRDAFKLLTNKDLCLKCHNIGNTQIEGAQGPNLTLAAERLRPDWAERWIANPPRMFTYQPVMPQNFPNDHDPKQWKFQDSFAGSPLEQTKAVRDIIMNLPRLNEMLATPTPAIPPATGGGDKK
jgi:mono/diheme cytochrome c family protein/nitrate reductase cytochrome c-type subunit